MSSEEADQEQPAVEQHDDANVATALSSPRSASMPPQSPSDTIASPSHTLAVELADGEVDAVNAGALELHDGGAGVYSRANEEQSASSSEAKIT